MQPPLQPHPQKRATSCFPLTPLLKSRPYEAPSFRKFGRRFALPLAEREEGGGGAHYALCYYIYLYVYTNIYSLLSFNSVFSRFRLVLQVYCNSRCFLFTLMQIWPTLNKFVHGYIPVSVAFVNWNEDVLFANIKSIDDLWILK